MPNLSDSRIGQIAIVCTDVARARDFYRDALGLKHLFDAGPTLSFFQCGTTRLMLGRAEGEATGTSMLYFFVPDIARTMPNAASPSMAACGVIWPEIALAMFCHQTWDILA